MTAVELVQKIKNLPPVSQAATRLIGILDRSDVDNQEIVDMLKYDSVLTAKLLRACNAPSLGLQGSISSVDQAVFLLGHQQIHSIVLTLAFGSIMNVSSPTYMMNMGELWKHSLISAIAAETALNDVATGFSGKANVAYTASLLHDIGKVVLAQTLNQREISEIHDRIQRKQIPGSEAEKEVLGVDHGEVGAALLQSWKLPETIIEAVANHHRPVVEPKPRLSAWVHIANAVAHHASPPPGQNIHDLYIAAPVAEKLEVGGEKLESMAVAVRQSFEREDRYMAMA